MPNKHLLAYIGLGTLNAMLVALTGLIVTDKVPIPADYSWVGVVLVAGLTFLTANLPKLEATVAPADPAPAVAVVTPPAPVKVEVVTPPPPTPPSAPEPPPPASA